MKIGKLSRRWLIVALAPVLALALCAAAISAELGGDETYRIGAGEVVDDDLYVVATEIYVEGTVKGDLFAAANYIELGPTGVIEGDLFALANGIVLHGAVLDDVRAASSGVQLTGSVGDDAFLAAGGGPAGNVPTGDMPQSVAAGAHVSGAVDGDLFVAAGEADISGTVGGDFNGAIAALDLSGAISGDADIGAGEINVSDAARVEGELRYSAAEQISFPAGVARDILYDEPPQAAERSLVGEFIGWVLRTAGILIGVAVVGWLLIRIRPNCLAGPAAAIRGRPLETGLVGLIAAALLFVIPVATILLVLFTAALWGILPAVAVFVFVAASSALVWIFSPLFTGLWLGEQIGQRLGDGRSQYQLFLLGALVIVILGRIPVLGWLVSLFSFLLALGGLVRIGRGSASEGGSQVQAQPVVSR